MPSLLKTYSLNTGFKIRKLKPMEAYFPVPEKYVTIQTSSGMGSKNYDLWIDVINSIHKNLKKHGYEILHIGKDGVELPNTKNLLNSTNFHQVNYIIRNSSLHIGNDSFAVHLAGLHEIPIVAVYGPTTIDNHGPHFKGKKTFLIESHRNGKNPTFSAHEEDKTINLIKSEEIVNNIYKALEIDEIDDKKTLFVGKFYPNRIVEIVPNCLVDPRSLGASEPVLRCDIESNDEIYKILNVRL
jgi:ADP-heptose:LPS heptosyltransferase